MLRLVFDFGLVGASLQGAAVCLGIDVCRNEMQKYNCRGLKTRVYHGKYKHKPTSTAAP